MAGTFKRWFYYRKSVNALTCTTNAGAISPFLGRASAAREGQFEIDQIKVTLILPCTFSPKTFY